MKVNLFFFKNALGAVNSIAITSTDRYMFSAGSDLNIKIWDMHLKTCVFTFERAHNRTIFCFEIKQI